MDTKTSRPRSHHTLHSGAIFTAAVKRVWVKFRARAALCIFKANARIHFHLRRERVRRRGKRQKRSLSQSHCPCENLGMIVGCVIPGPKTILVRGLVKLVPAVVHHFCLNLPATFSQPRTCFIFLAKCASTTNNVSPRLLAAFFSAILHARPPTCMRRRYHHFPPPPPLAFGSAVRPSGQLFLPAVVPPGWISAKEKVEKIKSCLIPLLVLGTTTCATLLPTCSQDHPLSRAATRNSCCERARAIMPHCAHSSAGRPPSLTH